MKTNDDQFEEQLQRLRPKALDADVESLFYRAGWDAATLKLRSHQAASTHRTLGLFRVWQLRLGNFCGGLLCGVAVITGVLFFTSPPTTEITSGKVDGVSAVPVLELSPLISLTAEAERTSRASSPKFLLGTYAGSMEADLLALELGYARPRKNQGDSIGATVHEVKAQLDPASIAQGNRSRESQSWKSRTDLLRELQL